MTDEREKPGKAGTELDLPDENAQGSGAKPSSNMSFGMLDLGGGSDEPALATETRPEQPAAKAEPAPAPKKPETKPAPSEPKSDSGARPAPYTIRSQRTGSTPTGPPMARSSRIREGSSEPEIRSARKSSKSLVMVIIVILVLALIGGGVYLFLRWQESAEKERQAELDRLNQQSRDSLMDDRFKNR